MRFLVLLIFIIPLSISAQIKEIKQVSLPSFLNESSGIALYKDLFYTHNDGGNPNEVYALDSNGTLVSTYTIQNANNLDWEAIQINSKGDLIIADIGNNGNNRQNLRFYKVRDFLNTGSYTLTADTIAFNYSTQSSFPPASHQLHFDAEAFIVFKDSLLIFTKNRSSPYNGYTYMHRIPLKKGNHTSQPIDSVYTGGGPKEFDWITDASLASNTLWLLSHGFVLRFDSFSDKGLTNPKRINLGSFSQKEAIAYQRPYLWVTDEKHPTFGGGKLYQYLADNLSNNFVVLQQYSLEPFLKFHSHYFELTAPHATELELYSLGGTLIKRIKLEKGVNTIHHNHVTTQVTILRTTFNQSIYHYRFVKP